MVTLALALLGLITTLGTGVVVVGLDRNQIRVNTGRLDALEQWRAGMDQHRGDQRLIHEYLEMRIDKLEQHKTP